MAYKSKYYDPVKAHEYYMKHRKLKAKRSKRSIVGMSKKGKRIASYVKNEISNRRKKELETHRTSINTQKIELKQQITDKLNAIRKRLQQINADKTLSKNQRANLVYPLKEQLQAVREEYQNTVQSINEQSKSKTESIKKSYEKTYDKEFKKIRADKSLMKRKKRKRSRRR